MTVNCTFKPAAKTPKPLMSDFGIPDDFSYSSFEYENQILNKRKLKFKIIFSSLILVILITISYIYNFVDEFFAYLIFVPSLIIFIPISDELSNHFVNSNAWELQYADEINAYIAALADWMFRQTEAGQGYWTILRGSAFEEAVAQFFNRRGCTAILTDVTGDGGVDIILTIGTDVFWCQCKGHAKPIPVAEIRRIAGATLKSKGSATPVMFATNGYTKPALAEAVELGVVCIDAKRLVELAPYSKISNL